MTQDYKGKPTPEEWNRFIGDLILKGITVRAPTHTKTKAHWKKDIK